MKNIILIGLGPHAKRIYINFIKKYKLNLSLLVDLDINKEEIKTFLKKEKFAYTKVYFVKSEEANNKELTITVKKDLKKLIKENKITYAIISTEPKAHFAYAKFLIKNNISILMDKPITSSLDVLNSISSAKQIKKEYDILLNLYKNHQEKIKFTIQCQRRFHPGYLYIKKILLDTIKKYNIPITYIDIYHSDGMWNMPNEFLSRENHPYKYGYGKLFHSGYHFIDILTWLLECNKYSDKKINNATIYSTVFRPYDFFQTVDNNFYKNYFNTNEFQEILQKPSIVSSFGELDFHSMIDFKMDDKIITHCTLNLMQSGFSKRAWKNLPKDTYKANGRVRHERVNIHVGPILNIQIHSYQSYEVNEKSDILKDDIGGIDHFDIYIFRNTKLIGGKSFEKIKLQDIDDNKDITLENNEKAREKCFYKFFMNEKNESDFIYHQNSILLLSKLCESIANHTNKVNFKWGSYEK